MEGIRHTWRRMPGRSRLLAFALPVVLVAGAAGAAVSAVTLTPRPTSTDAPQASAPPIAAATPLPLPPEPSVDPSASPEPTPTPAPAGAEDLVRAVGGVDVTLDRPYYDPEYWVTATHRGWGLPAGRSHLGPNDALIFARSRKGDNDFGRARRQQMLVLAALERVRKAGVGKLPTLLG